MKLPFRTLGDCKRLILDIARGPRFANLFVTSACTCRCEMCNFWRLPKSYMSFPLFREAVDKLESLGYYDFCLTGGEPLAHSRCFDFIRYLKMKSLYVSLPTNGTLLTERNVRKLKESRIDSVSVSVDSLDPEVAGKVRNHKNQLEKAIDGIRLLRKYGITFSVLIIVAKHNIREFPRMVKTLDRLYDAPSILCFPDSGVGPIEGIQFSKSELVSLVDRLLELKNEGYRLQNTREYLQELKRVCLGEARRVFCYGGYYVINVYWDGMVRPCFNRKPVGHIASIDAPIKKPCASCLNQCFVEFSYISDQLARKRYLSALIERWPLVKTYFES